METAGRKQAEAFELQETVVGNASAFVGLNDTPRYLDVRGQILEAVGQHIELDGWTVDDQTLYMGSNDEQHVVSADSDHVLVGFSGVDDPAEAAQTGGALLGAVLGVLQVDVVPFSGAGVVIAAAVNSFEDCTRWLAERLGPRSGAVLDPLGGASAMTNAWWRYEFAHERVGYTLEAGPMTSDAPAVDRHFLNPDRLDLPPEFLIVDLKREERRDVDAGEFVDHWRDGFSKTYAMMERFDRVLREFHDS